MYKDKIKIYTLEFIILAVLSFTLFVSNIHNKIFLAILLVIFTVVAKVVLKKRQIESINAKKATIVLIMLGIIYIIILYVIGFYIGYYKTQIIDVMSLLIYQVIPLIVIIISSEIIRNIFLAQNTKYTKTITFIIMVLIDLIIYIDIYEMNTFDEFIEATSFIFMASISCNLLYNYISNKYGIIGIIIYRIITILYVYILPIIPNIHIFLESILKIIYPYVIYNILKYTFTENKHIIAFEDKRNSIIVKVILSILIIGFAMLISCQFKYGILVVASESMTGTINKGDAIIFEKFENKEDIEEGEIIIFLRNDSKIVHRVIDVKNVNGETRYITKGDVNEQNDDGYITNNDIYGKYKFKISYIGYPSIWIRDIFSNN